MTIRRIDRWATEINQDFPRACGLCKNTGIKNRAQNRACSVINSLYLCNCIPYGVNLVPEAFRSLLVNSTKS